MGRGLVASAGIRGKAERSGRDDALRRGLRGSGGCVNHTPKCQGTDCYCDEIPTLQYAEGVERAVRAAETAAQVRAARESNLSPAERRAKRSQERQ